MTRLEACRIAQFSDLHLTTRDDGLLKGIDCWAQLHKMLDHLRQEPPVDGLVLTGDIAHDESRETYERLRAVLEARGISYWLIPGNHDDPMLMRSVFPEQLETKLASMCFSVDLGEARIVGLDTHQTGSDGGYLGAETMAWFVERCRSAGGRPVLVFMHHPPLDTGDAFFDTIGLQDRESFFETVQSLDSIKGIGFGHLHRSLNLWENPWVVGAAWKAFGMMKQLDGWIRST